jgi:outer membrane protein assembly factor BamB
MKSVHIALTCFLMLGASLAQADSNTLSVTEYHGGPDRSGHYVVPGLRWDRARNVHMDAAFRAEVEGHIYAQPLYWHPPGSSRGLLIVATEDDAVYALDSKTGAVIWKRLLGNPVALSSLSCGNIDPLGITGTPVIDAGLQAVYLDAFTSGSDGPEHLIFGLSLRDGSTLPGWPVNVSEAVARRGLHFNSRDQDQRGALTVAGGRVYVPYGGHFGDCGVYHGWVVGVSLHEPEDVVAWETRARGGGIWAPGGLSYADQSLFFATGNTMAAWSWSDGEAVVRLGLDLQSSGLSQDFFAPRDWRELDDNDADLGGTAPLLLNVPSSRGPVPLLLALGKDGKAYLLDWQNLGGIGGALLTRTVSEGPIRTAPAAFRLGDNTLVAFQGGGIGCPNGMENVHLTVLKINADPKPGIGMAWCSSFEGEGVPIVTTSDDNGANPIVWIVGAEGDDRLHGYRGDTGEELTKATAETMQGLRHFVTILAADGRLYVAADGRIYAFAF